MPLGLFLQSLKTVAEVPSSGPEEPHMFEDTRRLLVAIRAVSNEIQNAQALSDDRQDEELALYQSDLFDALGELAEQYAERRADGGRPILAFV